MALPPLKVNSNATAASTGTSARARLPTCRWFVAGFEHQEHVVGEHGGRGHQQHGAGHHCRQHSGRAHHPHQPGRERLLDEPQQGQVAGRALEARHLEDGGEPDEEDEQQDELVQRQRDRVAPEHPLVVRGEGRAEELRPHVEAERGEQHRGDEPRRAQPRARQCQEPGLGGLDAREHGADSRRSSAAAGRCRGRRPRRGS